MLYATYFGRLRPFSDIKVHDLMSLLRFAICEIVITSAYYRIYTFYSLRVSVRFFLLRILRVSWCPLDRLPARRRVSLVVGLPR